MRQLPTIPPTIPPTPPPSSPSWVPSTDLLPAWTAAQHTRVRALNRLRAAYLERLDSSYRQGLPVPRALVQFGSSLHATAFFPLSDLDLALLVSRTDFEAHPPDLFTAWRLHLEAAVPELRLDLQLHVTDQDPDALLRDAAWLEGDPDLLPALRQRLLSPECQTRDALQSAGEGLLSRTLARDLLPGEVRFKSGAAAPLRIPAQLSLLEAHPLPPYGPERAPADLEEALVIRAQHLQCGDETLRLKGARAEWLLRGLSWVLRARGLKRPTFRQAQEWWAAEARSSRAECLPVERLLPDVWEAVEQLRALQSPGLQAAESLGIPVSLLQGLMRDGACDELLRLAEAGGLPAALLLWITSDALVATRALDALLAAGAELRERPWLVSGALWNPRAPWSLVKRVLECPEFVGLPAFHRRRGYRHVALEAASTVEREALLDALLKLEPDSRLRDQLQARGMG